MTLPEAPADCTRCGACCLSHEEDYIRVFEVDWARMDERARALTIRTAGARAMRFAAGRCSALEVDAAAGTLRCGIYLMRPDACRWLKQGSRACREQIQQKANGALILLRRGAPIES